MRQCAGRGPRRVARTPQPSPRQEGQRREGMSPRRLACARRPQMHAAVDCAASGQDAAEQRGSAPTAPRPPVLRTAAPPPTRGPPRPLGPRPPRGPAALQGSLSLPGRCSKSASRRPRGRRPKAPLASAVRAVGGRAHGAQTRRGLDFGGKQRLKRPECSREGGARPGSRGPGARGCQRGHLEAPSSSDEAASARAGNGPYVWARHPPTCSGDSPRGVPIAGGPGTPSTLRWEPTPPTW